MSHHSLKRHCSSAVRALYSRANVPHTEKLETLEILFPQLKSIKKRISSKCLLLSSTDDVYKVILYSQIALCLYHRHPAIFHEDFRKASCGSGLIEPQPWEQTQALEPKERFPLPFISSPPLMGGPAGCRRERGRATKNSCWPSI